MTADDIRTLTDHTVNGIITANHENSALMRAEVAKVKMLGVIAEQLAIGNAHHQPQIAHIPGSLAKSSAQIDEGPSPIMSPADARTTDQAEAALRRHDLPGAKKKGGR